MVKRFIFALILLAGCSPQSSSDFRQEGESLVFSMIQDLKKVETLHDLEGISPKLKKKLDLLADLMIASSAIEHEPTLKSDFSDALKNELRRIYAIEGGQKMFESIADDALEKIQLNRH